MRACCQRRVAGHQNSKTQRSAPSLLEKCTAIHQTEKGGKAVMTILAEGKTKIIKDPSLPGFVDIESKPDITAGDGERHDVIENKDVLATVTTCNCFSLLEQQGIETHFVKKVDERTFRARHCHMIPIESVVRRIATGSYLKRNPEAVEGEVFDPLVLELFFKDDARHDPMMKWDGRSGKWNFYDAGSPDGGIIDTVEIICDGKPIDFSVAGIMQEMTRRVFLKLEEDWKKQDVALVDLKIEFGFDAETGKLLVADVIDNDSWRIWPAGDKTKAKDKQVYRDLKERTSRELGKIKENYAWVAKKTRAFVE